MQRSSDWTAAIYRGRRPGKQEGDPFYGWKTVSEGLSVLVL